MAAYPSYNILQRSTMTEESGVEDDFADTGTMHSRIFHSGFYRFTVYHQLSMAQWLNLRDTIYANNQRTALTGFVFYSESPARTYTVKFTGAPQIVENLKKDQFIVEVPLRGTAD